MKTSPTQRSLKLLRDRGWFCQVTERWNPFSKTRQDLYGFIDLLCMGKDELIAVQTTSGVNVSARIAKIHSLPSAVRWLASPSRRIVVHGWRKVGAGGKRKAWECREVELKLADFPTAFVMESLGHLNSCPPLE